MKKFSLSVWVIASVLAAGAVDLVSAPRADASLLLALLFWAAVAQGILALSAAADLSGAGWIKVIQPQIQAFYPVLFLFPFLFLVYARHVTVYSWVQQPTAWLNPTFFMARNFLMLLLPPLCALFYVRAGARQSRRRGLGAVLYLAAFVISQSFMAFDLLMTFDYPWVNTLFGGYFFVEAMYAGIAFMAIITGIRRRQDAGRYGPAFRDFVQMLMGFALLWAGLFFSQYLVTWYGNIPEEVSFLARRLADPGLNALGVFVLVSLFVIPFLLLISRKIKSSFAAVLPIALLVLSGLLAERLFFLIPVAPLSPLLAVLYLAILSLPFVFTGPVVIR